MENKEDTKEKILFSGEKIDPEIMEMLKAGVHFGHRASKTCPQMKPYIFQTRNNIDVIDLQKTKEKLKEALEFIKETVKKSGVILFVGTRPHQKKLVQEVSEELSMPYVVERWLGGTFTNFQTMLKRIQYLKDLENKIKSEEFKKYTKKEQTEMRQELDKLYQKFGGVKGLKELPEVLFAVDARKDSLAVKEAKETGVSVVAICDTNTDPTQVDWPIPASDDAISSLRYILGRVKKTILKVKSQITNSKTQTNSKS